MKNYGIVVQLPKKSTTNQHELHLGFSNGTSHTAYWGHALALRRVGSYIHIERFDVGGGEPEDVLNGRYGEKGHREN